MTQIEVNINYSKLLPIMGDSFKNTPLYFPLCEDSEYYNTFSNVTQCEFQKSQDKIISQVGCQWAISGYLENRATLLKDYPQMVTEGRFYHLGIDIHSSCGTKLYAPYDCEVVISEYEEGIGNYGGMTVLKCQKSSVDTFYLLFGHLNPEKLLNIGEKLKKGEEFAEFGNMNQNGNWFYHTHLQILMPNAFSEGWVRKGYCKASEISTIGRYCPNPFLFL